LGTRVAHEQPREGTVPFINGDIVVAQIGDKDWELVEPVEYQGRTETFTVPPGFRTDLASVPRAFVWLLPRYGRYTKAAILHDYLWHNTAELGIPRSDADGLFRRAMRELGVPFLRRWVMWAAVRWVSGPGRQLPLVLLVSIPALIFVAIPGLVITVWLFLFWLLELPVFAVLRLNERLRGTDKPANKPELHMTMS
jgi:hypothetical protein